MKRLENICKKIKHSNLVRFIRSKSIIRELNGEIEGLEKEKQKLIDNKKKLENQLKEKAKLADKLPSMQLVIDSADKSLKDKLQEISKLNDEIVELKSSLFNKDLELSNANVEIDNYKEQIKDLKSDRYLIRKISSGKTPNTIKTKVSRPMKSSVVRYMRETHDTDNNI